MSNFALAMLEQLSIDAPKIEGSEMDLPAELKKIEAELQAAETTVTELCREAGMARSTWRRWAVDHTKPNLATWSAMLEAKQRLISRHRDAKKAAA